MFQQDQRQLLQSDSSIDLPEKERALQFNAQKDEGRYNQGEIDDVLKLLLQPEVTSKGNPAR